MDQEDSPVSNEGLGPNEKLKAAREQRQWSQAYVANAMDVAPPMVNKWERGKHVPSKFYKEKLCDLFEMTEEELGFPEQEQARGARKLSRITPDLAERREVELQESGLGGQNLFQGKEGQPSLEENSVEAPFFPLGEQEPSISSSRDQHPSPQEKHQQEPAFFGTRKRPTSQRGPFRLRLSRPLLLMVCLLILIAGGVPAASVILTRSSSSHPPKAIDPEPIHSQPCSIHLMEYVVVHTTGGDHCFSGAESMPFSIRGVIRIETNDNIASWIYEKNDKEQRDPDNFDKKLHVCKHLAITYSPPVHLLRIFIASPLKKTRCTDNVASATVSVF